MSGVVKKFCYECDRSLRQYQLRPVIQGTVCKEPSCNCHILWVCGRCWEKYDYEKFVSGL